MLQLTFNPGLTLTGFRATRPRGFFSSSALRCVSRDWLTETTAYKKPLVSWGPFLERPGNLPGPESDFEIKVPRKVGRVLTSDEVHFVSLANNLTVQFSNILKLPLEWKTKQLNGPGNFRGLRETGPREQGIHSNNPMRVPDL